MCNLSHMLGLAHQHFYFNSDTSNTSHFIWLHIQFKTSPGTRGGKRVLRSIGKLKQLPFWVIEVFLSNCLLSAEILCIKTDFWEIFQEKLSNLGLSFYTDQYKLYFFNAGKQGCRDWWMKNWSIWASNTPTCDL